VQVVNTAMSGSQSDEIFLVCQGYRAPTKIDPRTLDPKCVFEQVDGQATWEGIFRLTQARGQVTAATVQVLVQDL